MTPLLPPRLAGATALGLWLLALALFGVAVVVGPDGQCDYAHHDAYVSAARRSGLALLGSALAMAGAASFLVAAALGRRRGRARVLRGLAALGSFALAGVTGLIGLLERIAFGCLE